MRKVLIATFCLWTAAASAKPWNGIEPGSSKRDEVVKRFGEPTRSVTQDGKDVLAYFGTQAIKGTSQTQFKVDPASQTVERIDVFPGPVIEREAVENTFGPACPGAGAPGTACYFKKLTDDFRTYFLYPRLGLAVFFNEDGKTVQSLIFQQQKATAGKTAETAKQ